MVLTRSATRLSSSPLPVDASATVPAPEPVAAPVPIPVPEELVQVEDLTEEDDEKEIHFEDPPEAGDAPAEAGDAPAETLAGYY